MNNEADPNYKERSQISLEEYSEAELYVPRIVDREQRSEIGVVRLPQAIEPEPFKRPDIKGSRRT